MNGRAAAKAVGVYLAILVPVGAWIGGIVWAAISGQPKAIVEAIALAPVSLGIAASIAFLAVWAPVTSLYDHFNRKGGK